MTEQALSQPGRITVGRHYNRLTILRLARLLIRFWHAFNRVSHNEKKDAAVRGQIAAVLSTPLFDFCRQLKAELGKPLSNEGETYELMFLFLSRRENIVLLPHAFFATATEWAEGTEALRTAAKRSTDSTQREALHEGMLLLKANMWQLLSCGLLAEVPASAVSFSPKHEVLVRLAGVLMERFQVLSMAAAAPHFEMRARLQMAEMRGFNLFRCIREQRFGRAERGVEGLAHWLAEPQPLRRRALISDMAAGLHDIGCSGVRLRRPLLAAPERTELQVVRLNALLVAEISYLDLLRTGFFTEVAGRPDEAAA